MQKLLIKYATNNTFELIKSGKHPLYPKKPVEVGKLDKYRFEHGKTSNRPMFTEFANTCGIFRINETLLHLANESYRSGQSMSKLERQLLETLDDYARKNEPISIMILGGKSRNLNNESFNFLAEVGNKIELALKELGIDADFTAIFGKKQDKYRDRLYTYGNEVIFNQEGNFELDKLLKEKPHLDLESTLNDYYEVAEIAPNHELKIFG